MAIHTSYGSWRTYLDCRNIGLWSDVDVGVRVLFAQLCAPWWCHPTAGEDEVFGDPSDEPSLEDDGAGFYKSARFGVFPSENRVSDHPMDRYNIGAFAKVLLVMFFLNAPREAYFLVLLVFSCHVNGWFEAFFHAISSTRERRSLEQTLGDLRRQGEFRRVMAAEAVALNQVAEEAELTTEANAAEEETHVAEEAPAAAPPRGADVAELWRLPWYKRFVYQLFVMFVMTLVPTWTPDPRYLE
eukprot:GHVU01118023.1.p1 GENE.GHVU01118023.1~~GHVU01118023.1.p1  ORF type:complete len:242 (-),score=30.17 GHVU01118023.1:685-1410(-)